MTPVKATPFLSRLEARIPPPVREQLRAGRAHLMVSRRTQSAFAAALAVALALAVRAGATAPAFSPHAATPPGTEVSIPRDRRLVTLPLSTSGLSVEPGTRVDLVAQSSLLVAGAVVVHASPTAVVVAVPAPDAPSVATAASLGEVSLVVLPD